MKVLGRSLLGLWLGGSAVLFTGAGPAQADGPMLRSDSSFARFALPYAPLIFDLFVQAGRSVAEITYDQRSYDPITDNFVISGLHVKRDPVDFAIRRLRVGEGSVAAEGLAFDTRQLPILPPLREGLKKLDREVVTGNLVVGIRRDDSRSAFATDLSLDMDGIGAFSISSAVDNFHVLVPFPSDTGGMSSRPPTVAGMLTAGTVLYRDRGLAGAVTAIAAEQQGMTPEQMQQAFSAMPTISVDQMLGELPGGASPQLRAAALDWARTVEAFIKQPDAIRVTLNPSEPMALSLFQSGVVDEQLIRTLNPTVVAGAEAMAIRTPRGDARTPLESAAALANGDAMLQDREAGATTLLGLASSGDLGAVRALASTFGTSPVPDLQGGDLGSLYEFLLVARALDEHVADTTLASLTAVLPQADLRNAEIAAQAYFRDKTAEGKDRLTITPDTVKQFDPGGLRSLAYDAYEGRGVPRDFTEAYTLSLLAAAAGDPLAPSLRDALAAAAHDKRISVSLAEARTRASALWAAYSVPNAQ